MVAMGEVLPYRSPKSRSDTTAYMGMVIFLASWAMMFAAIFFAYAFVRVRATRWPPLGMPSLPVLLPLVNTVVIAASSAVLQWGLVATRRGRAKALGPTGLVTLVLGVVFVALQLMLWRSLHEAGLRPDNGGAYGSVLYGLTWLHAAHVVVGLFGLLWLSVKAFAGAFSPARHLGARLWTSYWHFVGVVWALMFVSIFLL
jgi:cytochrome c oxidase subunit 3